ncbi:MAG: hypothetical protein ACYTFW_15810 [Planctomycetota bacterium]|jgi:hypothetical protein
MHKYKIFLSLIVVAVAVAACFTLSRNQETLTTTESQIEREVKVSSPLQKQQADEAISKQRNGDTVAGIPESPKRSLALYALDADIKSLTDEVVEYDSKSANYMLNYPVQPGRAKLQKQIRTETAAETFLHLSDNDNLAMLMPVMGGHPFSPGIYESDVVIVTKMTRIRKLLADGKEEPYEVAKFLERQIRTLGKEYSMQYEKYEQTKKDGNRHSHELPNYLKTRILCTTAVYVLSQIAASDSFPTLVWLSEQRNNSLPVNRRFLFYAMHNLVQKSPSLDTSGHYLEKAKAMNIADAKQIRVTAWNAHFHEDDFRRMLPYSRIDLQTQPTVELERFPCLAQLGREKVEFLLRNLRQLRN